MWEIGWYFAFSVVLEVCVAPWVVGAIRPGGGRGRGGDGARRRRLRAVAAAFVVALPVLPYLVVGANTVLMRNALEPAVRAQVKSEGLGDRVVSLWVLRWWPGRATVYFVTPGDIDGCKVGCGYRASTANLVQQRGGWEVVGESDIVWADGGSADGNVFPPFPGKGDFR